MRQPVSNHDLATDDFAIEGDELNALQDSCESTGAEEGRRRYRRSEVLITSQHRAQSAATSTAPANAPDTTATAAAIPAGSGIELKSGSRRMRPIR